MLFVDPPRKRVANVPAMWLAAAAITASPLVTPTAARDKVWAWAVPGLFLLLAAGATRVVARVGDRLRVRRFWGNTWLSARDTSVSVTIRPGSRGGASIHVELIGEAPGETIATYFASGSVRPVRDARRLADVLELKPPRLAPGIEALERASDGVRPRRGPLWIVLVWVALVALGLVVPRVIDGAASSHEGELYLRCRGSHQVTLPIGTLTLAGSTGFVLPVGDVTVELWRPGPACWIRRTLAVNPRTQTVLDLDALAAIDRCDRR